MTYQGQPDRDGTRRPFDRSAVFADFSEKFHLHEGISKSMWKIGAIVFLRGNFHPHSQLNPYS